MTSRRALGLAAVFLGAFVVLAVLVDTGWLPLRALDQAASDAAQGDAGVVSAARVVTDIGSPLVVDLVTVLGAVGLLVARRSRAAAALVVARLGSLGCESAVKLMVDRARPHWAAPVALASGSSFPSGHATGTAAVYPVLLALAWPVLRPWARWLGALLAGLLVAAVAASRVLLGVHYPSDVTAGVLLGLAWASGALLLTRTPHSSGLARPGLSARE